MKSEFQDSYEQGYAAAFRSCMQFITAYGEERQEMLADVDRYIEQKLFKNKLEYNRAMYDRIRHGDAIRAMTYLVENLLEHQKKRSEKK